MQEKEKEEKLDYRWTSDSLSNMKSYGGDGTYHPQIEKTIKELERRIAEEERREQKDKSNT